MDVNNNDRVHAYVGFLNFFLCFMYVEMGFLINTRYLRQPSVRFAYSPKPQGRQQGKRIGGLACEDDHAGVHRKTPPNKGAGEDSWINVGTWRPPLRTIKLPHLSIVDCRHLDAVLAVEGHVDHAL